MKVISEDDTDRLILDDSGHFIFETKDAEGNPVRLDLTESAWGRRLEMYERAVDDAQNRE